MFPLVVWPVLAFKKIDAVNSLAKLKVKLENAAQESLDPMDQKGTVD